MPTNQHSVAPASNRPSSILRPRLTQITASLFTGGGTKQNPAANTKRPPSPNRKSDHQSSSTSRWNRSGSPCGPLKGWAASTAYAAKQRTARIKAARPHCFRNPGYLLIGLFRARLMVWPAASSPVEISANSYQVASVPARGLLADLRSTTLKRKETCPSVSPAAVV